MYGMDGIHHQSDVTFVINTQDMTCLLYTSTVGPKYGKLLGGIRQALTDINGTAAMNELRTNGVLKLDINGNDVELTDVYKRQLLHWIRPVQMPV